MHASKDEHATGTLLVGYRQQAPDVSRCPSRPAGSSPAIQSQNDLRTDGELASGTHLLGCRQQAPDVSRCPSRPAGSEAVVTGMFLAQRQSESLGNSSNALLGPIKQVASFALLTHTQGVPCLSHGRGDRGRVIDVPYGGGAPTPPPRATRHVLGGGGDNERGRRKVKVDEA